MLLYIVMSAIVQTRTNEEPWFRLAAQVEFETLQVFGNRLLEPLKLRDVLVDTIVLEGAKPLEDLFQLLRVVFLPLEQATQLLRVVRVLAHFAAELADVVW